MGKKTFKEKFMEALFESTDYTKKGKPRTKKEE